MRQGSSMWRALEWRLWSHPLSCACRHAPCSRGSSACIASAIAPAGGTPAGTAGHPSPAGTGDAYFRHSFHKSNIQTLFFYYPTDTTHPDMHITKVSTLQKHIWNEFHHYCVLISFRALEEPALLHGNKNISLRMRGTPGDLLILMRQERPGGSSVCEFRCICITFRLENVWEMEM